MSIPLQELPTDIERREARLGALCGIAAYAWWGMFTALYMKAALRVAPVMEVVGHRVIWCVVLLVALVAVRRRFRDLRAVATQRRTLLTLITSAAFIALNWYLFAAAVSTNQLTQASLGYYINPLLSVLLGCVFLRERLRPLQILSVVLAAVAVTYLTVVKGAVPGLALGMAGSFGMYGLLRKVARVEAVTGLCIETLVLLPPTLVYLGTLTARGNATFVADGWAASGLLALSGPVTAIPLLLFVAAARRLRLATVGFMQYLAPTGQFLLAVLAFGEPFDKRMGLAFACIWTALAIYSIDAVVAQRVRS